MEALLIKLFAPTIISILLGWIGKGIRDWAKSQKDYQTKQEAYKALEAGVVQTQEEFVNVAKEAAKDGKLSPSEIDAARNLAKQKAIEIADDPNVIEAILSMTWNTITGLIDLIVQKKKEPVAQKK